MRVVKTEVRDMETGELIHTRETYGTNNGNHWVIMYRSASDFMARHCVSAVTFRVFNLLVSLQENFEDRGVFCTRKWLQDTLNISRKSVYNALTWLIEKNILIVANTAGVTEFYFNPSFVTIGRDKARRMNRWRELRKAFVDDKIYEEYGYTSPPISIDVEDVSPDDADRRVVEIETIEKPATASK